MPEFTGGPGHWWVNSQEEETLSLEDLCKETAQDPVLQDILPFVKEGRNPSKQERKSLGRDENSYINLFKTLREEDSIFYMHPPVVNGEKKPRRLCVPEKFARCGFVFSVPQKIHTDRGACFTAAVFQEVMTLLRNNTYCDTSVLAWRQPSRKNSFGQSILYQIRWPFPGKK